MRFRYLLAASAALCLATSVNAQSIQEPLSRPAVFGALVQCRTIENDAQRLACYDTQVAQLDRAANSNEIVIADRETVREAKRGLFGFSLPTIKLLNNGSEEIDEIEGIVRSASLINGKWFVTLEDGGRWQQVDTRNLSRYPKRGTPVKIRKAALGSFFANFDDQRGIKMKRVE
ncbi:hypothetical protein [Novosphingopyxis sp. YJ-S2-01]|uniref:hypothetical protein n=1 Tax=Novosphingopyxis sp. YJ-S2-01 TaxID=2794021 RepID=UPI0018DC77F9|nr:hypothetical protein [Novosphingopyxis sp. YJ-S2-01]MBH9536364.1 hypothetical protein [Novosphingopyxis sp. YJ-S2-01]